MRDANEWDGDGVIGGLQIHRQNRATSSFSRVHCMLGLERRMRPSILHLGNAGFEIVRILASRSGSKRWLGCELSSGFTGADGGVGGGV